MTAEVVGVEYNFKELNIMAGENKTPEYLAINPMHNIPAIVDGDFKGQSRKIFFCCQFSTTVLGPIFIFCIMLSVGEPEPRAKEPNLNCLLKPKPNLRIVAPAPVFFCLSKIHKEQKKFYRKKLWLLKKFL
jgi:hypothetical protein